MMIVGQRYFDAVGTRWVQGDTRAAGEAWRRGGAAIVNERFVEMHFRDEPVLGQRVRLSAPNTADDGFADVAEWMTVIGCVWGAQAPRAMGLVA